MIVIADFENEYDYKLIKGERAFASLEIHREAIQKAIAEIEQNGDAAAVEVCDFPGYAAWLKRNQALNSPQNVAMYVSLKHQNLLDRPCPEARHQNIEIHRND